MLVGQRADAEALWDEVGTVLAPMGLRLSTEKTRICHIDEGFDFLGWRIRRRAWRKPKRQTRALTSIVDKIRTLTRRRSHQTMADLLRRLNPVLRGWGTYIRHGSRPGGSAISTTSPSGEWSAGSGNVTSGRTCTPSPGALRAGLADPSRRDRDVSPRNGGNRTLPISGHSHPHTIIASPDARNPRTNGMNTWRAGCGEESHVRFGGRAAETHRPKDRQAVGRPLYLRLRKPGKFRLGFRRGRWTARRPRRP
ncbi:group II intron maturase-specific domain-containing protein [Actinomadura madurae]|uniref:group II intron maturase-specific domain-containing protein n=1 Tax=Actinomadura madurae TaxID=1993 RepID=UPI00399BD980